MTAPALPKDCSCQTHDGPHWLHMNRLWRERNRELLRDGQAALNRAAQLLAEGTVESHHLSALASGSAIRLLYAYAECEGERIARKLREMERRGLTEVPPEVPPCR